MLPWSGASSPAMTRSVVDLPEPEGPSRAKNSPRLDLEVDALQRLEGAVVLAMPLEARRRPWSRSSAASSLDGADGQALDDLLLRRDADDDHRQHGDQRGGGELGPERLLDRDEIVHGDGDGPDIVAAELDGEEELVPGVEEHEDRR